MLSLTGASFLSHRFLGLFVKTYRDDQIMPSGKDHKEDTWKESDLKKALKPEDKRKSRDDDQKSKERSSRRSEDRRGHREHDDEKKRRRHEDSANGEVDSRRTNKERDVERDREREQDRERRKREEKKDRERTKERDHDRDKRKEKDSEGLKERRTKDRSEERERSKDRRKEKERADKEHDRDRIRDKDRAIRKDKESSSGRSEGARERDRSKERRKDLDRNKEKQDDHDKSKERRKEKSGEKRDSEVRKDRDSGRSQGKDGSRERTKEREDRDGKNRDKDRDKQRERERNGEKDKSREHHKEKEKEGLARENEKADRQKSDRYDKDMDRRSKHTERSRERRQGEKGDDKREQRDDIDRRKERSERYGEKEKGDKIKRREKELMASLKQEEDLRREHLKFRSDTLEEADVIDEDVELNRKASLQRMPSVGTAEEVHDEENDGYHYDDDDFEDYDEDFEDDDDNEEGGDADGDDETSIDVQLLEALNAENEGARTSSSEGRELINEVHRKTNKENVKPMSTTHGRINFVAAKQKQISDKVASRTRRRGQELMHLIDLDVAAFDIFDLPPLNEYELYIKNFGRSDTKQAYVQCNEDNVEKEVQTEEIETRTKWTQNPASDAAGFGDEKDNLEEDLYSLTEKANVDSIRLASFLQRATQTCLILLEESVSEQTNTQFKEKRDMTCSDGYMQLATKHSYLEGRPVKFVHISRVQTHFLLIAYAPVVDKINTTTKIPKSIQDKGLICVWNTNEPSDPQKVLICESTPHCCCLSPSKATLAFAGLEDGSLVAWDLREPSSMHYMSKVSGGDSAVILRSPTFSTAGILKKDESHLSPVVSLLPLVMPGDSARASAGSNIMSDDMLGLSFQLASLEENAFIFLWVVVEFDKTNSAGSESDLGLSPGGKIKLIKSSSISLQSPSRNLPNKSSLQTLILKFLPHDPNHVYVGTDGGYVIHCDRHGSRSPPKAHRPGIDTMERIAAIDLSPWQLPCLLSGSENGNLWLFTLKNEFPLLSWPSSTSGSEILSIQWSHSRPSVFYVLDSQSNLHVWDLLKSDKGPVAVEKVKHGRVTCFELSSDYSASGIGTPGRNAELVLVYESGAVEIHRISSVFSKASGDDLDRFASYLESVL